MDNKKQLAFNPYLPGYEYVPDGEPHIFGDRVYIYGSHDRFGGSNFCELDYVCWSAPVDDLGNWKYEGIIYRKTQDPMNPDGQHCLYAPDIAQGPDGAFYLFYGMDFTGVIGVARAERPEGPFTYYGNVHDSEGNMIGKRPGDALQYDPGIFVDEDGRIYLYSGFCTEHGPWDYLGLTAPPIMGGMCMELSKDMLTVIRGPQQVLPWQENGKGTSFEGHEFFEASSMRKVRGKYYYIYSSVNGHELCYAVSDYPDRDFTYGGTIISNGDIFYQGRTADERLNYTGTNHGSIIEIAGQWYVFYHRQTNGTLFNRQGCAEPIEINETGKIGQVEITSCGLNGDPLPASGRYTAGIACNLLSKEGAMEYSYMDPLPDNHPYITQEDADGIYQYIANMTDGSCCGFKYFSFCKESRICLTYRGTGKGALSVGTTLRGEDILQMVIEPSGNWNTVCGSFTLPEGVYPLYVTYCGLGYIDFKEMLISE